jgi:hypothetical protein
MQGVPRPLRIPVPPARGRLGADDASGPSRHRASASFAVESAFGARNRGRVRRETRGDAKLSATNSSRRPECECAQGGDGPGPAAGEMRREEEGGRRRAGEAGHGRRWSCDSGTGDSRASHSGTCDSGTCDSWTSHSGTCDTWPRNAGTRIANRTESRSARRIPHCDSAVRQMATHLNFSALRIIATTAPSETATAIIV